MIINGNNSDNVLVGGDCNDTIFGFGGNDTLFGRAGNDYLNGGAGDDSLYGELDNDCISGGSDNDSLSGGVGNDYLNGGAGNDTYLIDADVDFGLDTILETATSGIDDIINFRSSSAAISIDLSKTTTQTVATGVQVRISTVSIEAVYGGEGNDTIIGNNLNNYLAGYEGNDTLYGGAGNDILFAQGGDDYLNGGDGNDYLNGSVGNNYLVGGAGNDAYDINGDVDFGLQTIIEAEGSGYDILNLEKTTSAPVSIDLSKTTTQNVATDVQILISAVSIEEARGGEGNDTIIGNYLDNDLYGNAGNDILLGGAGNDALRGGLGSDTFQFNYPNEGIDIIFDLTAGDKIGIFAAGFGGGLVAGTALDASQILVTTSGISTNSSQRFIYNSDNGGLFYDVDGNGTSAAVQVGILSGLPSLTASDFVII